MVTRFADQARERIESLKLNASGLPVFALAGVATRSAQKSEPIQAVRAPRAKSNSAVAAHDAKRLRNLRADDFHGIQGISAEPDSGGAVTAQSYADEEFSGPSVVTYLYTPVTVTRDGTADCKEQPLGGRLAKIRRRDG